MVASIRRLIRKYGLGLTTNGIGYGVSLVAQIIFARLMGASEYGILVLSSSLVLLPVSLADLGVAASTPRFLAVSLGEGRPGRIRTIIRQSAIFTTIVALLLLGIMLWLAPHIAVWMTMPALTSPLNLFAVFIPGIYLHRWCLSVLKGLGRNTTQIMLESSVLQLLMFGLGVGFWFTVGSVEAVVLGHGLAYFFAALVGLFCVMRTVRSLPKPRIHDPFRFREVIRHGFPLNITALAQRLFRRCDILVIGALLGEKSVGLYRVANALASGIKKLMTPINSFALFYMAKNVGRRQIGAVSHHYSTSVLLSLSLALPAYLISFVFADEITIFLFGKEYASAASILKVLSIGFAVFVGVGPMGAFFNALGKNWVRMWMVLAMSVFNIIANIIFIKWVGLIGAAFSTALSFVVLYFLFNFFVKNTLLGYGTNRAPIVLMLLTAVLGTGVEVFFLQPLWAHVASAILGALTIFSVGMVLTFYSYRSKRNGQSQSLPIYDSGYVEGD